MKLLLRRDQESNVMGNMVFILDVRAELADEEKSHISKYKLGNAMLYQRKPFEDKGQGLFKTLLSLVVHNVMNLTVSVNDLFKGKRIECKDVAEMLAVEDQIKEACQTLKALLHAASSFGGEEVVEI